MPTLKQRKPQGTAKELPPTALSNRQWLKSAGSLPVRGSFDDELKYFLANLKLETKN